MPVDAALVSRTTARQWLSVFEAGFILHLLAPWCANLGKRLVKAGATVASDDFTGLQRLSALMAGRVTAGAVVYGGDSAQPRSGRAFQCGSFAPPFPTF